jgi:DNA-binding beta-propeller fold protein YncE
VPELTTNSVTNTDAFVVRLTLGGVLTTAWARRFGSVGVNSYDRAVAVAVGPAPDHFIYVAGMFTDTANFGDGDKTAVGDEDVFVLKLDSGGNTLWSRVFPGSERVEDIALDSAGNVVLVGSFDDGSVDLGGGARLLSAGGARDMWVVKLAADGTFLWDDTAGQGGDTRARAVAIGPNDEVWVAGEFDATVSPLTIGGTSILSLGGRDVFLVGYDP